MRELNEETFVSQLHGVEIAKIDKILSDSKEKEKQKHTEDTSNPSGTPSAEVSVQNAGQEERKSESQQYSEAAGISEASESKVEPTFRGYIPEKARATVSNPLYELKVEGSALLDVLFKDIMEVYIHDEELDIFAYTSEDYLDDIRRLTEQESASLDVREAHDLMDNWVHYIKPIVKEKKAKHKKVRKWKLR